MSGRRGISAAGLVRLMGILMLAVGVANAIELLRPLFGGQAAPFWQGGMATAFFALGAAGTLLLVAGGIFALTNAGHPRRLPVFIVLCVLYILVYAANVVLLAVTGTGLTLRMLLGFMMPVLFIVVALRVKKQQTHNKL